MADKVKWRYAYDGLGDRVSAEAGISFEGDPGKTVQSAKDDADINTLMKRFGVTGKLPAPNMQPFFADLSEVEDYQTALNQVMAADQAFAGLSADVRHRFHNDPGELWDYLHSEMTDEKLADARQMGLLQPEKAAPPVQRVEVVNPPSAPPGAAGGPPGMGSEA